VVVVDELEAAPEQGVNLLAAGLNGQLDLRCVPSGELCELVFDGWTLRVRIAARRPDAAA